MSKKPSEFRELKVSVENPAYDRRRKHGSDAVETFKAGTRFLLHFYGPNDGVLAGLPHSAQLVKPDVWVDSGQLVKLFFASSVPVEPSSFADLKLINQVDAEETLTQLLKDGVVTAQQVAEAQAKVQARRDAEEAEEEKKREARKAAKAAEAQQQPVTGSVEGAN